jgi:hypothetical protein
MVLKHGLVSEEIGILALEVKEFVSIFIVGKRPTKVLECVIKINIQRKYILYKVVYINHLLYEVIYVYVYQTLVFILGVHMLYP